LACFIFHQQVHVMPNTNLLFYDGLCPLCSRAVQFVIKNESEKKIKFVALQSNLGQKLLEENDLSTQHLSTLLFLENGVLYKKSQAIFRILSYLPSYRFLLVFRFLPLAFSDSLYDFVAKNREKWRSRDPNCWLPQPSFADRFL
jgi:predicted DCC family thiol-disulfide oxidoreductase YuxK